MCSGPVGQNKQRAQEDISPICLSSGAVWMESSSQLPPQASSVKLLSRKRRFMTVSPRDYCASGTCRLFRGGISTNERVISVTLCLGKEKLVSYKGRHCLNLEMSISFLLVCNWHRIVPGRSSRHAGNLSGMLLRRPSYIEKSFGFIRKLSHLPTTVLSHYLKG
ncbi:Sr-Related And Ctd-Associated Factor 4 [Manis pentadactyla]|nr:Sr-Related And Ctd-Associated Factor 4 [Manis pentadactyla]